MKATKSYQGKIKQTFIKMNLKLLNDVKNMDLWRRTDEIGSSALVSHLVYICDRKPVGRGGD